MSLTAPQSQETALVGRIVQSNVEANTLTIKAQFEDRKTGVARTPQSTTRVFTLSKDTERFEMILADSHVTAAGVTTITVNANGRNLNKYGNMIGAATGNKHPINSEIGCADTHIPVEILNEIIRGNEGTNANNFRIGNETNNDVTIYAQNADANKPFFRYDADAGVGGAWVFSNNGVDTSPMGGDNVYTAGDGLSLVAGDFDIDTSDNVIFVNASAGAGDQNKVPILNASGLLDDTFFSVALSTITATPAEINQALDGISANVTDTNLNTLTGGGNADTLHTHAGLGTKSLTTKEAIDGSTNALPVSLVPSGKDTIYLKSGTTCDFGSNLTAFDNMGELAANYKKGQSFSYTNSLVDTIKVEEVYLPLKAVGAPADNIRVVIYDDNGGEPGSAIANGTSNNVAGGTIETTASGDNEVQQFTFGTAPTITSGTTYWIVFERTGAADAVNYYQWGRYGNVDAGSSATFTAGPDTWATSTNDHQYLIKFDLTGGGLVKTGTTFDRNKHVGWTKSNVGAAGSAAVSMFGTIDTLTGLTLGQPILSSGTGTYSSTGSGPHMGYAISTTEAIIDKPMVRYSTTNWGASGATVIDMRNTVGNSLPIVVKTGIRPISVFLSYDSGDGNVNHGFIHNGLIHMINDLNTSEQYVTAQTNDKFALNNLTVSTIENGLELSCSPNAGATQNYNELKVAVIGK